MNDTIHLWLNGKIATFSPNNPNPYGLLENHVMLTQNGKIVHIGPKSETNLNQFNGKIIDVEGAVITPGFIDCHTHLVYGGNRSFEWEQRLNGVSYQQIAQQGGGILSTVRETRTLSLEQLVKVSRPRLEALVNEGVTTIEIKSGYGLSLEQELKQLQAAKILSREYPVDVITTLLAAHTVAPEYKHDPDAYVDYIIEQILPVVVEQQLADAVDVFCESVGFSYQQSERLFKAAQKHGLPVKGHVEQLSDLGGSELVARYNGLSVDHIEYLSQQGIDALKKSSTVAVLLPSAFYFMRETKKPPIQQLRDAGIPMAVSTDFNPGTSPAASIRLAMNQACVLFELTPEEAMTGTTRHAAAALGLSATHGQLATNYTANFLVWQVERPVDIIYNLGLNPLVQRVYQGNSTLK